MLSQNVFLCVSVTPCVCMYSGQVSSRYLGRSIYEIRWTFNAGVRWTTSSHWLHAAQTTGRRWSV